MQNLILFILVQERFLVDLEVLPQFVGLFSVSFNSFRVQMSSDEVFEKLMNLHFLLKTKELCAELYSN